ncbi:hypothetical protein D9M68_848890 [compost metagenome]
MGQALCFSEHIQNADESARHDGTKQFNQLSIVQAMQFAWKTLGSGFFRGAMIGQQRQYPGNHHVTHHHVLFGHFGFLHSRRTAATDLHKAHNL